MKNKIILLLVLLIPSLCFGKTIKSTIHFKKSEREFVMAFNVTQQDSAFFKFITDGEIIFINKNMDEWILLLRFIDKHFPAKSKELTNALIREKPIKVYHFFNLIEQLAIHNNFAITFKEWISSTRGSFYFYRPDK